MQIPYSLYSGTGNTFFFVDDRKETFPLDPEIIQCSLFQKSKSIDGLILVQPSLKGDFRMRIFNPDASEAEMCGNGLRCFICFLKELGLPQLEFNIEVGLQPDTRVLFCRLVDDEVSVEMGSFEAHLGFQGSALEKQFEGDFIDTGVPHFVLFLEDLDIDVDGLGRELRFHPLFAPKGTNVNFVRKLDGNCLALRTYERGVERETLACGTGATAAALLSALRFGLLSPIEVQVQSGEILKIDFTLSGTRADKVSLQGGAALISKGVFVLNEPCSV